MRCDSYLSRHTAKEEGWGRHRTTQKRGRMSVSSQKRSHRSKRQNFETMSHLHHRVKQSSMPEEGRMVIESSLRASDVGEAEDKAEVDPIPPLICAGSNLFWRRAALGFTDSYDSLSLRSQITDHGKARRQTSKRQRHQMTDCTDNSRAAVAVAEEGGVALEALRETTESTKPLFPGVTRSSSNTTINWTWYPKRRRLSYGRLCAETCPTASGSPAHARELSPSQKIT